MTLCTACASRTTVIGISDSRLDEIFDPFPIADSEGKSQKFERIGLSLAIAKKYIKMHEGYISVDSIMNLETTFCIHIPEKQTCGDCEPWYIKS